MHRIPHGRPGNTAKEYCQTEQWCTPPKDDDGILPPRLGIFRRYILFGFVFVGLGQRGMYRLPRVFGSLGNKIGLVDSASAQGRLMMPNNRYALLENAFRRHHEVPSTRWAEAAFACVLNLRPDFLAAFAGKNHHFHFLRHQGEEGDIVQDVPY